MFEMSDDHIYEKDYITYFSLTTSVKGVARITKSEKKFLRILWIVAVLGFLSVATSQVYFLLNEYLNYPTTTNLNEQVLIANNFYKLIAPQVTVCNLNSLSSDSDLITSQYSIPKIAEFGRNMDLKCSSCTNEEEAHFNITMEASKSSEGYFQYIGKDAAQNISHQPQSMIALCLVNTLSGFFSSSLPCSTYVDIVPWFSPKYYNCYKFKTYRERLPNKKTPIGLTLLLYVDAFESMPIPSDLAIKHPNGFVVSVDLNDQVPFTTMSSFHFEPNKNVYLEISESIKTRLTKPYSDCIKTSTLKPNGTALYTQRGCTGLCVEEKVLEICKCVEVQSIYILADLYPDKVKGVPYCADMNLSVEDLLKYSLCLEKIRLSAPKDCERKCPPVCTEVVYSAQASSSLWPDREAVPLMYHSLVKDKAFREKFPPEEKLNDDVFYTEMSRQFLRLTINHGSPAITQYNDTATITSSNFLSRLGGALNLWSGITIIVIMEIIDVLYRALWFSMCSRKEDDSLTTVKMTI